ncbi:MAG: hypothetical protein S4CHLAM20_11400 [Chlamydiia bacterium]|nr:hypothetical protein [Chlamydiia bacterium]
MNAVDRPYSELDLYYHDNKPRVIEFLDLVTEDLRLSWGAKIIYVQSHRVFEGDSPGLRAVKIILSIVFAPFTLIGILCFLIKMAVSASLQNRATIQNALNDSRQHIETLRGQFFDLLNQGENQEVLDFYRDNKDSLREQSDILDQISILNKARIDEDFANTSTNTPSASANSVEELQSQFSQLMDESKSEEAFALFDSNLELQDLADVSTLVSAFRSAAANSLSNQDLEDIPKRPAVAFDAQPMLAQEESRDCYDIQRNALALGKKLQGEFGIIVDEIQDRVTELQNRQSAPTFTGEAEEFIKSAKQRVATEQKTLIDRFQDQITSWENNMVTDVLGSPVKPISTFNVNRFKEMISPLIVNHILNKFKESVNYLKTKH